MIRRSVTSGMRRHAASSTNCCARVALRGSRCCSRRCRNRCRCTVARLATARASGCNATRQRLPSCNADCRPAPASHDSQPHRCRRKTRRPPPAQPAQTPTKPAAARKRRPRDCPRAPGDLNLHGLSLNAALFTIGEQWNINIVAGEVQGTVNGVFKQAPLREILDAILLSNGYNYRAVGKSLVVSNRPSLGQINPFFQSATIPGPHGRHRRSGRSAPSCSTRRKGQVKALKAPTASWCSTSRTA